jgi:hypothetical protein
MLLDRDPSGLRQGELPLTFSANYEDYLVECTLPDGRGYCGGGVVTVWTRVPLN